MIGGNFLFIVPAKALKPCANGMTRDTRDPELQQQLAGVDWGGELFDMHFLPGGGLAIDRARGHGISVAVDTSAMVAFNGTLSNHRYLLDKYCVDTRRTNSKDDLEAAAVLSEGNGESHLSAACQHLSEADVIMKLYHQMGTTMLPILRGEFSFCVFDSETVRVLAARDPHGGTKLTQARAADGSLVIASGDVFPKGCTRLEEVPRGHFKYGWSAPIQRYTHNAEDALEEEDAPTAAAAAATRALEGSPPRLHHMLPPLSTDADKATPSAPHSESGSEGPGYRLRTRRGKRAGRHQQRRASLEVSRASLDTSRTSLDMPSSFVDQHLHRPLHTREGHTRPSRLSLDSQRYVPRASDMAAWWRNDASREPSESPQQRQSIDCGSLSAATAAAVMLSPLAPIFEPTAADCARHAGEGVEPSSLAGHPGSAPDTLPEASSDTSHSCQTQSHQTQGPLTAADASRAASAALFMQQLRPGDWRLYGSHVSAIRPEAIGTSAASEATSCADSASGSTHVAAYVAAHVTAHVKAQLPGHSSLSSSCKSFGKFTQPQGLVT